MNLTWHLVKKDLVRARLHLLVWVALLGYQVFVSREMFTPAALDMVWLGRMAMHFNLLVAVQLLVSFLLVAMLVMDDPLAGSDMFWVTRPISGGRLLGAKIITAILLFGLLPAVLWTPWWLYCGFTPGDLGVAALQTFVLQCIAIVPAFVLGSLVGRTGRFVLVSVVIAMALFVVLLNFFAKGGWQAVPPDLAKGRVVLALLILGLAGVAVVLRQYFTRRLNSSMAILIGAVALAVAALLRSPWTSQQLWPEAAHPVAGEAPISGEILLARDARRSDPTDPAGIMIDIEVGLTGVSDEYYPGGGRADVELRWDDGHVVVRKQLELRPGRGPNRFAARHALGLTNHDKWNQSWDDETDAWVAQHKSELRFGEWEFRFGELHVAPGEKRRDPLWVSLVLSREEMEKIHASPPACTIRARIEMRQPEIQAELPLKSGTTVVAEGARLELLGLNPVFRSGTFSGTQFTGVAIAATALRVAPLSLYKLNRSQETVWFLGDSFSMSVLAITSRVEASYFGFFTPRYRRGDRWIDDAKDFDESVLVALSDRGVGSIQREFHTAHLTLGETADQ